MGDKIQRLFFLMIYFLVNGSLKFITKLVFSNESIHKRAPERILLMRNGSIGDSITAFPAISAIKSTYPDAELIILTNSGSAHFIGMKNLLEPVMYSTIINYYDWSIAKLFREIRKLKIDLFINLSQDKTKWHHELRRILFIRLVGIKRAVGFEVGSILIGLKWQLRKSVQISETQRLNNIVKQIGIEILENNYPIYFGDAEESIIKWFLENDLVTGKIIAVVIGAKREQNRWPLSHWKLLIDGTLKMGLKVIVIGSKEDSRDAVLLERIGVFNMCGRWSINQTAAAMRKCDLVISNDTGPMHLAYAIKTKVIGIFSAWQLPNIWFPPPSLGVVLIDYSLDCSLCYSNRCKNNICMQLIDVERVLSAVQLQLKGSKP